MLLILIKYSLNIDSEVQLTSEKEKLTMMKREQDKDMERMPSSQNI